MKYLFWIFLPGILICLSYGDEATKKDPTAVQEGCICPKWRYAAGENYWSYYSERQCPTGQNSTWVSTDLPVDLGELPNQECCGGANCETVFCGSILKADERGSVNGDRLIQLHTEGKVEGQSIAPFAIKASVAASGLATVMDREDEMDLAAIATIRSEEIVKVEVMKRGKRSIIHVRLFHLIVDPNGNLDPPPIHVLKGFQTTPGSEQPVVPWNDVTTPTSGAGAVTRFIVVSYDGRSYNVLTQNQIDGK